MGFLQHDTSNIIVDVVLTVAGRQALARNDGSFTIVKFAVGDDEVNYDIVKQYGRTLGREKIEKNTPVFEAQVNENLALKHRCISVSNPTLIKLPRLTLTGEGVDTTSTIVSMSRITNTTRRLNVTQAIADSNEIDPELRDQVFIVKLNSQFLQVVGQVPDSIDARGIATYLLTRDVGETSLGGSSLTFTLKTKSITDTMFTVYGTTVNKNIIKTYVSVSGVQSGATKDFEVQISKT